MSTSMTIAGTDGLPRCRWCGFAPEFDLKKRGWKFVGPTTVYAFMQAMGLVNDHVQGCVVADTAAQARMAFQVPT